MPTLVGTCELRNVGTLGRGGAPGAKEDIKGERKEAREHPEGGPQGAKDDTKIEPEETKGNAKGEPDGAKEVTNSILDFRLARTSIL